jgi:hypothetical protein
LQQKHYEAGLIRTVDNAAGAIPLLVQMLGPPPGHGAGASSHNDIESRSSAVIVQKQ